MWVTFSENYFFKTGARNQLFKPVFCTQIDAPPLTSNLNACLCASAWELTAAPMCSLEFCHTVRSVVHIAHHVEKGFCVVFQQERFLLETELQSYEKDTCNNKCIKLIYTLNEVTNRHVCKLNSKWGQKPITVYII